MVRRVVAGLVALVLAAVGVVLVVAYAQGADQRAMAGQETVDVLVATQAAEQGSAAESLGENVELRSIPKSALVSNALTDLKDVKGQLLTVDLAPGQQLHEGNFATEDELRAEGQAPLPDGVEDLHQVTVPLDKARALGGNVAVGDTVGVFMSFDVSESEGYVMGSDGRIERVEGDDEDSNESSSSMSMTHLTLHKVPVVRVEGAYVAPPPRAQDDEDAEEKPAEDTLFVTLALPAPDAERLVFGMEWGQVWLSLEPESADENGTDPVVVTVPETARNVLQ